MLTNRFFYLFMALTLVVVAALVLGGVVVTAKNSSSAYHSDDRIRQIQLENTHPSAKTAPEIVTGQSSAGNGLKQPASLSVGPGDELEYCTYTPGQRICRR